MAITTLKKDANGDLFLPPTFITGVEAVVQHLKERFQFFLGEWFLDTREGVSYYRDVLVKNPNLPAVRSIFRRIILGTQDIVEVRKLELSIETTTRTLSADFIAVLDSGDIIDTSKLDEPFIITI